MSLLQFDFTHATMPCVKRNVRKKDIATTGAGLEDGVGVGITAYHKKMLTGLELPVEVIISVKDTIPPITGATWTVQISGSGVEHRETTSK